MLGDCPACGDRWDTRVDPQDGDKRVCGKCGLVCRAKAWNALCEMAAKARAWDAEMAALKPMGLTRTRKLLAVSMERKRGGLDV